MLCECFVNSCLIDVICVCLYIVVSNTLLLYFCFVFLRLVYPTLPVSLDCPFVISPRVSLDCPLVIFPRVFSNLYCLCRKHKLYFISQ